MSRRVADQLTIVLAGSASLAIAMGVGRFAFTPILPMMLHDGTVDLTVAGRLATANYVGYLVGALAAMLIPKEWPQTTIIKSALLLTVVLTALMALPFPTTWTGLRFLAGVASAIGFVFTSGWCLAELTGSTASIGSAIFTGPGAGIAVSGLAASVMTALSFTGQGGWTTFAVMSAAISALIWRVFRKTGRDVEPFYVGRAGTSGRVPRTEMPMFAVAYGLAGFGYIVTATYLPVIAKNAIPDSPLLTVFWPLFGISAVVGSLLASRVRKSADARLYLIGSYLVQAAGVAMSVVWEDAVGLAFSSILVGVPFTAISYFAMNEVRRIRSSHHARYMGLLTAVFAVGQIMGPPVVGAIFARQVNSDSAFALALGIASITLVVGAVILVAMIVMFPARVHHRPQER
ncbi:YbfB/YjiJ family MFS transporter [Sinorhizobium medicae]|uniref:YbfB/YjiJ family MFS transporter n=1 Tax=Sinorhizobium medicae TaxID=110321 RepID=UPI00129533DC|nr:YbfB/YjiJ family MFS transporter [Sinorhizobium medicae]MDX0509647.1 YbfB/YjiJ family MFS transporter [Sinorhizobium medicae]MDX0528765.1 YbfB/YjiJ family MFS transporter [Sinorhizobium medicae]MDX0559361.1 YbfB/YjiJ family MFS transporter [Sinorhizobium medicae]MDX0831849.1 YbfB/YjiJ family MFS transporter [Sinorhizobium medicae]MDX0921213.1 YbfB/YjiJ family MFS transporter [Sinorhizobium medicae]